MALQRVCRFRPVRQMYTFPLHFNISFAWFVLIKRLGYKEHKEHLPHTTAHTMTNHPTHAAQSSITLAEDDYAMQEAPNDEELEKAIALSMVEAPLPSSSSEQTAAPVGPPKPLSTPSTVLERLLEVVLDQFKNVRGRGGIATIPYLQVVHALTKKRIFKELVERAKEMRRKTPFDFMKVSVNGLPPARLTQRLIQVLLPQQLGPRSTPVAEEDYLSLVLFWILLGKAKKPPAADSSSNAAAYAHVVRLLVGDTQLVEKLYNVSSDLLQLFKRGPKNGDPAAGVATPNVAEARVPGALLTERTATPMAPVVSTTAFSASPFFSETYARSHKDLFQNFPKILSEVVMRLVLAIYSCANKQDQPTLLNKRKCLHILFNFYFFIYVFMFLCFTYFFLQNGSSCYAISYKRSKHPLFTSTARDCC